MNENTQSNSSQEEIAISVKGLSKAYRIWRDPGARLKAPLWDTIGALVPQKLRPSILEDRLGHHASSRYYKDFYALKDISFEIKKGEAIGIIGRNGSGKSTLLQMIAGTLTSTSGSIKVSGRVAALLELGSGFNPEFTGRENVYLNASVLGLTRAEVDERMDQILSFAEIGSFIDQPVKTYSSGMIVRLAFAVSINVTPDLLIIDEALSVGDELFQRKCFSWIETIKASGTTILFVSHSGASVIELCDRAIMLDTGQLICSGHPKTIVNNYHRLLFAPAEKKAEIKENLLNETSPPADQPPVEAAKPIDQPPIAAPTSTITYESRGAVISNPSIQTFDGCAIQNLQRGQTYNFCYDVHFTEDASYVHFGMLIKTSSGLEIGGGVSAHNILSGIPQIKAGSTYQVTFKFRCALNPATYFLNCGVVGNIENSQTYLHRIIDAAMIRVEPTPKNTLTGIVDLLCEPTYQLK